MGGYALAISISLGRESRLGNLLFLTWLDIVPQPYLKWGKIEGLSFPLGNQKEICMSCFCTL